LDTEIENFGGSIETSTGREHTLYEMKVLSQDVKRAVNILGDIIQNPIINQNQVNEEKDTIKHELEDTSKELQRIIVEATHFNCFRDHFIGQPCSGDIDNINNITPEMIKEFHSNYYTGENLVVVGTGNINHKEFVDMVANSFGNIK
jgi:predicted Zn-dependent peptidase